MVVCKMVVVALFNNALKLTWIRRLLNAQDQKWAHLLRTQWPEHLNFTIFGKTFTGIQNNIRHLNSFWKDVFNAVMLLHVAVDRERFHNYFNEPLWYNDSIRIDNKSVFIKKMYECSIYTVNDLLDKNGKFLSIQEFETLTGIHTNFIEYNGLLMAVRQFKLKCYPNLPAPSYKLQLPLIPNIIQPIKSAKKGCRSIYQFLAKENLETPTSHVKWENEIQ